jgi:MoaA/NifB/PqqE/SkfB family radical SAM enzyme
MSGLMREMGAKALRLGLPLSVHLDLTYRCNERCVHCYLDHEDHGEMSTAEILDLLDQLAEAGVFFLILSGGEIFLRKDLFEIVEYARKLQFSVKLKTNAVLLREASARRIAALGVQMVQISVYSHRPEVHDKITKVRGSLKRTIEGARLLRANGVRVQFANVLMKHNASDYPQVQALAAEMGVGYNLDATITPMMDGDRSIVDLNITPEELEQVYREPALSVTMSRSSAPRPAGPLEPARRLRTRCPAAPGTPRATSRPMETCCPACSSRCKSGNVRKQRFHRHLEELAAAEGGARDQHGRLARAVLQLRARQQLQRAARGWRTWKATCAGPRSRTARSLSPALACPRTTCCASRAP